MSYYFIRHEEKEYDNGKGNPKLDPGLNKSKDSYYKDILKDVSPDIIYCSPFRRCRQTSKRHYPSIEPIINNTLNEYLGHWRDIKEDYFEEETYKYIKDFKFEDNTLDLRKRLKGIYDIIIHKNKVIVVVTHGLCLEIIYLLLKKKYNIIKFEDNPKIGFKIEL